MPQNCRLNPVIGILQSIDHSLFRNHWWHMNGLLNRNVLPTNSEHWNYKRFVILYLDGLPRRFPVGVVDGEYEADAIRLFSNDGTIGWITKKIKVKVSKLLVFSILRYFDIINKWISTRQKIKGATLYGCTQMFTSNMIRSFEESVSKPLIV